MTHRSPEGRASRRRTPRRRQAGFTLIELMIVVAIVGILATIAYPSYRESVLKGRRAEARTALLELMQQQERYMTQRGAYLKFIADNPAAAAIFKIYSGDAVTAANAKYKLSAAQCPAASGGTQPSLAECIQLTATPQSADPVVNALSLTSTGARSCDGVTSGSPTITANPKLCWP